MAKMQSQQARAKGGEAQAARLWPFLVMNFGERAVGDAESDGDGRMVM